MERIRILTRHDSVFRDFAFLYYSEMGDPIIVALDDGGITVGFAKKSKGLWFITEYDRREAGQIFLMAFMHLTGKT